MSAQTEAFIIFVLWEWWLGAQQWFKAKSTIALFLLIGAVIVGYIGFLIGQLLTKGEK